MIKYLIFFLLFTQSISGQVDSLKVAKADSVFFSQDYTQALDLYVNLIETDSIYHFYYERAGISAYRLGDFKKTKELFLKLEELDEVNLIALRQLASIYEIEGSIGRAIKYYSKLIKLNPDNAIFQRKLGQQYLKGDLRKEAFIHLSKANQLNPKDNFAISGLVEIFLNNKQFENADSLLESSLAYDESNLAHRLLLAKSKYTQKDYAQTVLHLDQARGSVDLNSYYHKMLGYSYLKIDSVDLAINYLERSLVKEGTPEHAHYYLASAYNSKGDHETAIFHYEKAIEAGISKDVDIYHRNLAKIFDQKKDLKKAIPHYEDAYKYGKSPVILFYLARAYDVYYEDKNVAIRYYRKYEKSADKNPEYKNYAKERRKYLQEQMHFQKARKN